MILVYPYSGRLTVSTRVSQNATKCIYSSDIVHMAVSIHQEPPKKIW